MQPQRNRVLSPGLLGPVAKWKDMIWSCVINLPQAGGHMRKQEEVPADLCSGIWQGRGARQDKQAWDDGDGRGWKHPSHTAFPWSTRCAGSGRFPACSLREPSHLLPGGEACAVIIAWEGHLRSLRSRHRLWQDTATAQTCGLSLRLLGVASSLQVQPPPPVRPHVGG